MVKTEAVPVVCESSVWSTDRYTEQQDIFSCGNPSQRIQHCCILKHTNTSLSNIHFPCQLALTSTWFCFSASSAKRIWGIFRKHTDDILNISNTFQWGWTFTQFALCNHRRCSERNPNKNCSSLQNLGSLEWPSMPLSVAASRNHNILLN